MEKLVNGSAEYVEKESKRYVSRRYPHYLLELTSTCLSVSSFRVCWRLFLFCRITLDFVSCTGYLAVYHTSRLAKILEKRNLSPAKLDEIKIKANVLKSFLEARAKDVKETIVRAEAEL